ncbi:putative uncharacterized protein [Bacteroides sp. CAG:545]|nr:putative uncharacterized protein [Bacteroides sp. CAG:545]
MKRGGERRKKRGWKRREKEKEKKRREEEKKRKRRGKEDEMKHLCFGREWLLYVVTVCLAAGFAIAGFYALAAAGDIRKLPLRRLVMIAIVGLYSIRVVVGIGWLLYEFTCLQFFSTLVPAFLVYCYLPGLKRDVNNQMLP